VQVSKLAIRDIRVRAVAAPMQRPLATSTGAVSVAPLLLLDLRTTGGITGRAYLFGIGRNALAPIAKLVEAMAEMVKGDAVAPFEIERKLRARHTLLGVHNIVLFAMSGIDMAAWDALGQALGEPMATLLGGKPQPALAYNSKGLGIQPLKPLANEAVELVKEGIRRGEAAARQAAGRRRYRRAARGEKGDRREDHADGRLQPGTQRR
jgi:mandelate racemase